MGAIRILPPDVANQIAAGEVVERPASVVKELVENALDAGARRVRVEVQGAGVRRIVVDDDGMGMSREDAALAFVRHATSKLATLDDLKRIASFGFRGEALAAIASVSAVSLHTGEPNAMEGTLARCIGGGDPELSPAPPRRGTRVEVRDLFFNAPARRKFLRSRPVEEQAILDAVRALALAHPEVAFTVEIEGRTRARWERADRFARAVAVLGGDAADYREGRAMHEGVSVWGVFALPTHTHRDASKVFWLVNGRPIRDRMLLSALRRAYQDVMLSERFPIAVVCIEMDPAAVDVNVHPAKREVRFARPAAVRQAVVQAALEAIGQGGAHAASALADDAVRLLAPRSSPSASAPVAPRSMAPEPLAVEEPQAAWAFARPHPFGRPLGQVQKRYIVTETTDGLLLIDPHAVHERILYERGKALLAQSGSFPAQRLLAPHHWRPDAEAHAWLKAHAKDLARFGILLAEDEDGWRILGVPALLAGQEAPERIVEGWVQAAIAVGDVPSSEQGPRIWRKWFADRACKAATTFGRAMTMEEIEALLAQMAETPNIAQCNHGRPTYVRLGLKELERLFARS